MVTHTHIFQKPSTIQQLFSSNFIVAEQSINDENPVETVSQKVNHSLMPIVLRINRCNQ